MANGVNATVELLRRCGYEVDLIEAGCCGMAGTFGYESHHFELSQAVAELKLFPALREALASATDGMNSNLIVASSGSACRLQISQGLGVPVAHPMELLKALL
jgi:Fe-S oxidoreductase